MDINNPGYRCFDGVATRVGAAAVTLGAVLVDDWLAARGNSVVVGFGV